MPSIAKGRIKHLGNSLVLFIFYIVTKLNCVSKKKSSQKDFTSRKQVPGIFSLQLATAW